MNILEDPDIEQALIGDMLHLPARMEDAAKLVLPEDFYRPAHQAIWAAMVDLWTAGEKATSATVMAACPDIDRALLLRCSAAGGGAWRHAAERVVRLATARRVQSLAAETLEAVDAGKDTWEIIDTLKTALANVEGPVSAPPTDVEDYDEFCDRSEQSSPWIIKGLLRQHHRMVYVGGEGAGKTLLLQSIAMCAAAGLHPFNREIEIPPVRALHVDLENSPSRIRHGRDLIDRGLRGRRGESVMIWSQPGGIDLRSRADVARLEARIHVARPQVVVMGPLYKAGMNNRRNGETDEQVACGMQLTLDQLRTRHRFALVLEHHPPHGDGYHRKMRPRGSAAWLGWAEFGHGLDSNDQKHPGSLVVDRFRGDREPAAWPDRYDRGKQFPWDGRWNEAPHPSAPDAGEF